MFVTAFVLEVVELAMNLLAMPCSESHASGQSLQDHWDSSQPQVACKVVAWSHIFRGCQQHPDVLRSVM